MPLKGVPDEQIEGEDFPQAAAEVFVRLNGQSLPAGDDELERLTLGVADGSISNDEVLSFFRLTRGRLTTLLPGRSRYRRI